MHVQHFTLLSAHRFGNVIDDMLRLRHKVFVRDAQWAIPTWAEREADEFDTALWTHYFALYDDDGVMRATGRNIRCDHPYMLKKLWPDLAYGAELPSGPKWAEGSRMCVDPEVSAKDRALYHTVITLAAMEWAWDRGIERFCFVTYPWAIKALSNMGLEPTSYGPPMGFGEEKFLAGHYSVAPEFTGKLRNLLQIGGEILRDDEEELAA
ncbi:MAG: hypothetical protein COA62_11890 [Rhodobiaceae bacterium]|nr:MAG: hypothetical protein COA62_11890 [Rhodobiaceae bacterium]